MHINEERGKVLYKVENYYTVHDKLNAVRGLEVVSNEAIFGACI